jgi:hypothetical protein
LRRGLLDELSGRKTSERAARSPALVERVNEEFEKGREAGGTDRIPALPSCRGIVGADEHEHLVATP